MYGYVEVIGLFDSSFPGKRNTDGQQCLKGILRTQQESVFFGMLVCIVFNSFCSIAPMYKD